jgi:hypothetical protein
MRFNRSTDPHVPHGPRARQPRGCQRCSACNGPNAADQAAAATTFANAFGPSRPFVFYTSLVPAPEKVITISDSEEDKKDIPEIHIDEEQDDKNLSVLIKKRALKSAAVVDILEDLITQ